MPFAGPWQRRHRRAGLLNAALPTSFKPSDRQFSFDSSHCLNHRSNILRIIAVSASGKEEPANRDKS